MCVCLAGADYGRRLFESSPDQPTTHIRSSEIKRNDAGGKQIDDDEGKLGHLATKPTNIVILTHGNRRRWLGIGTGNEEE